MLQEWLQNKLFVKLLKLFGISCQISDLPSMMDIWWQLNNLIWGKWAGEKTADMKAKAEKDKGDTVAELVVGNIQQIFSPYTDISL